MANPQPPCCSKLSTDCCVVIVKNSKHKNNSSRLAAILYCHPSALIHNLPRQHFCFLKTSTIGTTAIITNHLQFGSEKLRANVKVVLIVWIGLGPALHLPFLQLIGRNQVLSAFLLWFPFGFLSLWLCAKDHFQLEQRIKNVFFGSTFPIWVQPPSS